MPKKIFVLAVLWSVGIAVACLVSSGQVPSVTLFQNDKLLHVIFYLGFTAFWLWFLYKYEPQGLQLKHYLWVYTAAFFYGIVLEFLQEMLTTSRKADWKDVLANMVGATLGLLLVYYFKTKFQKNN